MLTDEIAGKLCSYPHFLGVFPSDGLGQLKTYPSSSLIVNTDPSREPGEHWTAVFFPSEGPTEYFDSFGFPPLVPDVFDFLDRTSKSWRFNSSTMQHLNSQSCGLYCISFIKARYRGISFDAFVRQFHTVLEHNESQIIKEEASGLLRARFKGRWEKHV